MKGHGSKFPLKIEQAILLLLQTGSIETTAKALNVGTSTLARWMKTDVFQTAFANARRQAYEVGLSRLQVLTGDAIKTLKRNLNSGRPLAEIRAALGILEYARHGAEVLDLSARLNALETERREKEDAA